MGKAKNLNVDEVGDEGDGFGFILINGKFVRPGRTAGAKWNLFANKLQKLYLAGGSDGDSGSKD